MTPPPSRDDVAVRAGMRRQALSIGTAIVPFGLAFGALAIEAGLQVWQAAGFSLAVFAGSGQFAAVSVVGEGGSAAAAIAAGLLLNVRSLVFGVVMAPDLGGPVWRRALHAQLMIDEAIAVASTGRTSRQRRYGYIAGGLAVFVLWNASTVVGAALAKGLGDLIGELGLDATIPAAFLALVWPRLSDATQRRAAIGGVAVALVAIPLLPPGLGILAAALGVLAARTPRRRRTGST